VIFFGLYTPLQGTTTIGEAIAKLNGQPVSWTMVGSGQDRAAAEAAAGAGAPVRWLDWVDAAELPALVAAHDVCLGIFGTGPKAQRVVPNKVFQGAAAGCAIVTSDSLSQREAVGDAALLVPPGDATALSEVITGLINEPSSTEARRRAARETAETRFTPSAVVNGLTSRLTRVSASRRPHRPHPPLPANAALRWHVVRQRVDELAPTRILELGAGQGAVAARLADVADYVGVEPDETSRTTARSRLPADARVVADTSDLAAGERFDLVCAFEVLEHIEDDAGALTRWTAHLQPGGHVLVSVPAGPERFGPFDELVGHLRRYSRDDLADLFRAASLEVLSVEHYGYPLGALLEAGRNVIGRRRLAAGGAPVDVASRTAGSGRNLQPPAWAGSAIWTVTTPFRMVQRRFPGRGPGLVGLARRPV
jgi:SAM-dependent methyltransferase